MEINENSIKKDSSIEELFRIEEEIGQRIVKKFREVIISGVEDSRLLTILIDKGIKWKDFFRPTLTSLSCHAVGGKPELTEDVGLIFTLASSGFGIHDDILDRSSFKHLRETIRGKYGVDSALLVGDLLIVKGWTIFNEMIRKTTEAKKIANIMEVYGNLSVEICEAEFMETMCQFCGGKYKVFKRVEKILDPWTNKLRRCKNLVILEGLLCHGDPTHATACDRTCLYYWNEAWLERVSE